MEIKFAFNIAILETLTPQLNQFGLNPLEWQLVPLSPEFVQIQNMDDEDFIFIGQIDLNSTRFESLKLASI